LQSVANQLAVAIDQAELYEQARVAAATATRLNNSGKPCKIATYNTQATLDSTADGILVVNQVGKIAVLIKVCGYVVHSQPSSIA